VTRRWRTGPEDNPSPVTRHPLVRLAGAVMSSVWTYRILTLLIFLTIWQVYAEFSGGLLIPTVPKTAAALVELLGSSTLWSALYVSNQALVLGFLISVAVGVPVGVLLGRFPTAEKYTNVYLNILLVTPMAAIIPLLVMSVGFGLASRVILVTVFAIVMVIVNARAGVRQVDPSLIQMARSFGASEATIWRRILIPGALPAIMTGVRLGLGRAVTGMVIVELLMVSVALGRLILQYRGMFQAASLYAVIIVILAEALILISVVGWLEQRFTPWVPRQQGPRIVRTKATAR
jgi:ABC-type nitrate/sulfonate/bicarbonate transport system permease component